MTFLPIHNLFADWDWYWDFDLGPYNYDYTSTLSGLS
jgi:hypothetical protein